MGSVLILMGGPEATAAPTFPPQPEEPEASSPSLAEKPFSQLWPTATATALPKEGLVSGLLGPLPTLSGTASYYAQIFEGGRTACGTVFSHSDPTVAATRTGGWACGTRLTLTGPAGTLTVTRLDGCGGCGPTDVDLSMAGFQRVCGALSIGRCSIRIGAS